MSLKIYCAARMTGRDKREMVEMALANKKIFESFGITVLDPILEEHVKPTKGLLIDTPLALVKGYWKRDKQMIRESHVIIDTTPGEKSEGVAHEIGYGRYFLWKPIVRLYKSDEKPGSAIVYFEDDLVVHSVEEAAIQIQKYWGTWFKRAMWRTAMYKRSWLKACWYKLLEWK
jgi:hypothetical protein